VGGSAGGADDASYVGAVAVLISSIPAGKIFAVDDVRKQAEEREIRRLGDSAINDGNADSGATQIGFPKAAGIYRSRRVV
jgi:hypothetical protein